MLVFTLSSYFINGVDGLPFSMVSIVRYSARQPNSIVASELEIVPEPIMDTDFKGRIVELLVVYPGAYWQLHLKILPLIAQFIQFCEDRSKCCCGLHLHKAKAFF
jgi:hypothetical protein